jgi:hypothetical protein
MAIGLSIFLITIGAIFRFGITVNLSSLDFHAIGLIIMFAGLALLLIQMYWIVAVTTARERRRNINRDTERRTLTGGYRDTTRDDSRPPYYLGPPLDDPR